MRYARKRISIMRRRTADVKCAWVFSFAKQLAMEIRKSPAAALNKRYGCNW
jgi:hypothetical protein